MSNPTVSVLPSIQVPALRLAGSDDLIDRLVRRHGGTLFRFLLRLTHGDVHRSEDIYQETLIRAWRHPQACRESLSSGPGWLITVARRISIDQMRAAARRPDLVRGDQQLGEAADPVDEVGRMLLAREVRAALASLSGPHREMLRLAYFEDRPVAEVAARLGIPVGTVKSRTYYALRALADAMAARGLDGSLAQSA